MSALANGVAQEEWIIRVKELVLTVQYLYYLEGFALQQFGQRFKCLLAFVVHQAHSGLESTEGNPV